MLLDDDTSLPSTGNDNPSQLSNSALNHSHAHQQSNAFSIHIAINPLVAIAAPLLAVVSQLSQNQTPDTKKLLDSLSHEVKVFENRAHAKGYRSQVILAARYFLCALIDETIQNNTWGKDSHWQEHGLLHTFQRESWGGERFFTILERSAQDAVLYIDVLELGYICLSLGFQGRFRSQQDKHELGNLIDNLYNKIRQIRGDSSRRLLISPHTKSLPKTHFQLRPPPIWVTALITAAILIAIFIPYHQRLQSVSTPIQKAVEQIGNASLMKGGPHE